MDKKMFVGLGKDDKDFEDFFRHYHPKLMAYCRLILDEETSYDVVQDVFVYVWVNKDRLDFSGGFQSYLYQTTYSKCLDVLKHRNMMQEKFSDVSSGLLDCELSWIRGHQEDILADMDRKDLQHKIDSLIQDLPVNRRKVFILSFKKEMSNDEISDLLDMPKRTVESHLYLSLKYLRSKLVDEDMLIIWLLWSLHNI